MKRRVQKVLQIDDDDFDLKAFARNFKRASEAHELKQARSVEHALQILEQWEPNLILLDLGLPDAIDPVPVIEAAMPPGCALVILTGASVEDARQLAHGHEVRHKSTSSNPLMRGGAMIPVATQVAAGQISLKG